MFSGLAAIMGLVVGVLIGGVGVASTYGESPTVGQGVVITVLVILWFAVSVIAILGEEQG